jgi:hypothetical protein
MRNVRLVNTKLWKYFYNKKIKYKMDKRLCIETINGIHSL